MGQTEVKMGQLLGDTQKKGILWNKELTWVKNVTMIWFVVYSSFPLLYNQMTLGTLWSLQLVLT